MLVAADLLPFEEGDDDTDQRPKPPHENRHGSAILDGTVRLYNMPLGTD